MLCILKLFNLFDLSTISHISVQFCRRFLYGKVNEECNTYIHDVYVIMQLVCLALCPCYWVKTINAYKWLCTLDCHQMRRWDREGDKMFVLFSHNSSHKQFNTLMRTRSLACLYVRMYTKQHEILRGETNSQIHIPMESSRRKLPKIAGDLCVASNVTFSKIVSIFNAFLVANGIHTDTHSRSVIQANICFQLSVTNFYSFWHMYLDMYYTYVCVCV